MLGGKGTRSTGDRDVQWRPTHFAITHRRTRAGHPFAAGVLLGLLLLLGLCVREGSAEPSKLILALGDDSYIPADAVNASTGAAVKTELGNRELVEFAVVILSNIAYDVVPRAVRERLPEFLQHGGSLLITGGPNAFGSGGYQSIASLIPFEIRGRTDWVAAPFKAVIPLQPNHPILSGVTFRTVGTFNDLNPKRSGAVEIAHYAGGATFDESGKIVSSRFPSPLIAEQRVGQGTVLGVAFDIGREIRSGWSDGTHFVQNALTYLTARSPLKPRTTADLLQAFLRWQESCDEELRRGRTGGAVWRGAAADCRRQLAERRYPHMDLVDLWLQERLKIAEQVDNGELSAPEGGLRIKALNTRITTVIEQREKSGR